MSVFSSYRQSHIAQQNEKWQRQLYRTCGRLQEAQHRQDSHSPGTHAEAQLLHL